MIGQLILSSDWLSQDVTGNKMDSNNLATLFAPNILHSMKAGPGDGTMSPDNNFKAAERTETINIVRTLIDFNKELFELCWEDLHSLYVRYCVCTVYCTLLYCTDLHSLYVRMHEDVPEAMDYLLRRRALLNGDEYVLSFRRQIFFSYSNIFTIY